MSEPNAGVVGDAAALGAELEKARADHQAAVEQLNAALAEKSSLAALVAERDAGIAERESRLQLVTGRYRDLVVALPDVAPAKDFVTGNTVEEIDAAVEKAKSVVAAIRTSQAPAASTSPATPGIVSGGVTRQPPDYSALSAIDKIKTGVALRA